MLFAVKLSRMGMAVEPGKDTSQDQDHLSCVERGVHMQLEHTLSPALACSPRQCSMCCDLTRICGLLFK